MRRPRAAILASLALLAWLPPRTPIAAHAQPAARWQALLSMPNVHIPTGLAIDPRGKPSTNKWAYVADAATHRIVKFGTGGTILKTWSYGATGVNVPVSLAVGGKGNVFVANPATGTVSKFSPTGALLRRWTGFGSPGGIAVDASGNIYVPHQDDYQVDEISGGGSFIMTVDTRSVWGGGSVGKPLAVALNLPDGSWYLATQCIVGTDCGRGIDTWGHFPLKDALLELTGGTPTQFWFGLGHSATGKAQEPPYKEAEPFVTIDAMVNDAHGNLYVAGNLWPLGGTQGRGVVKYSPLGSKLGFWYLPSQAPIKGIAVDGRKTLYVTQGHQVLKLSYPIISTQAARHDAGGKGSGQYSV